MAVLGEVRANLAEIANNRHGTTTTTNALLERNLNTSGLITTKGFRDVLSRHTRPNSHDLIGRFGPNGMAGGDASGVNRACVVRTDGNDISPHLSKDQGIQLSAGECVHISTLERAAVMATPTSEIPNWC